MMLTPRSLVTIAVYGLCVVTVAVQSRPSIESDEQDIEMPAESPEPSVLMFPIKQLTDPNSKFAQMLGNQLLHMSDQELKEIEAGLAGNKNEPEPSDDQDMMMGDMPSADDPQDSSSPATSLGRSVTAMPEEFADGMSHRQSTESADPEFRHYESSTSDKNLRIQTIHNQMINFMGRNTKVPPPSPMIKSDPTSIIPIQQRDAIRVLYDNLNNFPSYLSDSFTEKMQSFYPTCDLPKHTNEEVWNTKESMNLMFNISLPKSSKGISVNVNMARLRLYKQYVACYSQSSNETDDSQPCQPQLFLESLKKSNTNLSTEGVIPLIIDERQIRVSIYAYTRSLKRKRVKRKLLDSRMVPYYSEKWTEWNIRNAVKAWHRNPVRNYGISVEVEDEDGNLLPVTKFFRPMNCSGDAQMMTPKPMPGFLMEAMQNGFSVPVRNPANNNNNNNNNNSNKAADALSFSFNTHMYPIMDVTTVEVPESEANNAMLYQYAKNAFEQVGGSGVVSPYYLPTGQEDQTDELQHRTRHGSRQHRNNGTVPGSLSRDGHELRDQIIAQSIIQRNVQYKSPTTEIPD